MPNHARICADTKQERAHAVVNGDIGTPKEFDSVVEAASVDHATLVVWGAYLVALIA